MSNINQLVQETLSEHLKRHGGKYVAGAALAGAAGAAYYNRDEIGSHLKKLRDKLEQEHHIKNPYKVPSAIEPEKKAPEQNFSEKWKKFKDEVKDAQRNRPRPLPQHPPGSIEDILEKGRRAPVDNKTKFIA